MRLPARLLIVFLAAVVLTFSLVAAGLGGGRVSPGSAAVDGQGLGVALKAVSYVGKVAALPSFVGIAAAGSLLIEIADAGSPKDSISIEFQRPPSRLELGLSMSVDVDVKFGHEDGWLADEKYWVELVTIADGQIIKRMIYPKTGIKADTAFSSDSEEVTFSDKVWIGAQEYKCVDGTTTYEFKAVVWSAQLGGPGRIRDQVNSGDLSTFISGTDFFGRDWEKKTWDEYLAWMAGRRVMIAKDEKSFDVTLVSPYFVEVDSTDDGITAEHGTSGKFAHSYTVNMNYRQAVPSTAGIVVLDPQPQRATVDVDRLDPIPDWVPWAQDEQLTWTAGQLQKDSVAFTDRGAHVPDPRPHTATYTGSWGAKVTGRNTIEVQSTEDPSTIRSVPYTWTGPFWLEGVEGRVCAGTYQVTDFRPPLEDGGGDDDGGGGDDPTPTPTPFEPPPVVTPTPTVSEPPPVVTPTPVESFLTFEHTQPGVESEVTLQVFADPGTSVTVTLAGPGLISPATQSTSADAGGVAQVTWRINLFGTYSVTGSAGGSPVSGSVDVQ